MRAIPLSQRPAVDVPRFWSQVDRGPGCWPWRGQVGRRGYGEYRVRVDGKRHHIKAHRIAYTLAVGEIPAGALVCHRCDNRRCVNPEHLFVGTDLDNVRDKIAKGRARTAKLTWDKAVAIRDMRREGFTHKEIARAFGVSPTTVGVVLAGKTWVTP